MATIDANVLQQERSRLEEEVSSLNTKIATLGGEIKAHLQALGISEADVEKSTVDAKKALTKAEAEFNALYEEYEVFKAKQASTVLGVSAFQQPTIPQA